MEGRCTSTKGMHTRLTSIAITLRAPTACKWRSPLAGRHLRPRRHPSPRGRSQMRFEKQPPQDVTEPLVCKIPFIERRHHPVIEKVELRFEELVVRLERRTEQPAFRLEPALDGCSRVRQHPAERRDG